MAADPLASPSNSAWHALPWMGKLPRSSRKEWLQESLNTMGPGLLTYAQGVIPTFESDLPVVKQLLSLTRGVLPYFQGPLQPIGLALLPAFVSWFFPTASANALYTLLNWVSPVSGFSQVVGEGPGSTAEQRATFILVALALSFAFLLLPVADVGWAFGRVVGQLNATYDLVGFDRRGSRDERALLEEQATMEREERERRRREREEAVVPWEKPLSVSDVLERAARAIGGTLMTWLRAFRF